MRQSIKECPLNRIYYFLWSKCVFNMSYAAQVSKRFIFPDMLFNPPPHTHTFSSLGVQYYLFQVFVECYDEQEKKVTVYSLLFFAMAVALGIAYLVQVQINEILIIE